jgi:dihydroorotate dehydrogenase
VGVFNAADAYEKIQAGASLVEIYTGFVYGGPGVVRNINRGLLKAMKDQKWDSIQNAVGSRA